MTEHTPTPWKVSVESHADYITDRQGHVLVSLSDIGSNPIEQAEIAAFIVEAVNNHEALKARVKELEATLECVDQCIASTSRYQIGYAQKIARKALDRKGEK